MQRTGPGIEGFNPMEVILMAISTETKLTAFLAGIISAAAFAGLDRLAAWICGA